MLTADLLALVLLDLGGRRSLRLDVSTDSTFEPPIGSTGLVHEFQRISRGERSSFDLFFDSHKIGDKKGLLESFYFHKWMCVNGYPQEHNTTCQIGGRVS